MKLNTLPRVIKLGITNFQRHLWLSLVATLIMTLTLLIISVFIIFNIVINTTTESIKEKIDLSVYFNDDIVEEQVRIVENKLINRLEVKSVHFVSKEEALERWNEMKISASVKEQISDKDNPLPFSLDVKTQRSEDLEKVDKYLSSEEFSPIISKISYKENKDIIDRLINITNFSKKLGLILGIIFVVISILVIINTVRLTIYTRSKEIEIMRLVGASDIFVKIPFIVEAFLYSLIATIFSLLLIWLGLYLVSPMITNYLGEVTLDLRGFFLGNLGWIFLFELLISSVISITCSLVSMNKHLRV